jgi:hypothetical protein
MIRGVWHRIDTMEGGPVHSQPYRAGLAARKVGQEEVKMLKDEIIEPSSAESPVVLVPKGDGNLRFCIYTVS